MMHHQGMGVLHPYNEDKYGWALDIGYEFARSEYELKRFYEGKTNQSDTIKTCNNVINSLNGALSRNGIRGLLPYLDHTYRAGHTTHQHKALIRLLRQVKSDSHAAYYLIGTAIGERHLGFDTDAVRERIGQLRVWFHGFLDTAVQREILFNLTEAGCNRTVLPKDPLDAKAVLRAMFEPKVILYISTDPSNLLPLSNQKEYRVILKALKSSKLGFNFDLKAILACRPGDLGSAIHEFEPTYLHFSGHGDVAGLVFEKEDGQYKVVDHNPLANLLKVAREESNAQLRGAFLNACYSAENGQILANSAGALVAIRSKVNDDDAIAFAEQFYKALGHGSTYESSFHWAVAGLGMHGTARDFEPCLFTAQVSPVTVDKRDRGEMSEGRTPLDVPSRILESTVRTAIGDAGRPLLSLPDSAMSVTRLPERRFTKIMFSPCGDYFLTLNEEGIVSMWDLDTGGHVSNLLLDAPATAVAFCPEKKFLACAVRGKGMFLAGWNCDFMRTGRLVDPKLLTMFHSELLIVSIALSCGAERLAVVSRRGMARTYRIANTHGKVLRRESLTAGGDSFCDRVAMSDDGRALVYAHTPDLLAAEFPQPKKVGPVEKTTSMFSGIRDVVALPRIHVFIVVGKSCDRFHAVNGKMRRKTLSTSECDRTFTHVVASSDGNFIMVADEEGIERIQLTNPKAPAGPNAGVLGILEDQPSSGKYFMAQKSVACMALSPHNDQLIAATSSGLVKVWDLHTEYPTPRILMGQEEIYGNELWAVPSSLRLSPAKEIVRSSSPSPVRGGILSQASSPVRGGMPSQASSPVRENMRSSSYLPVRNEVPSSYPSPVEEAPIQETPVRAVQKLTIHVPYTDQT